MVKPNWEIFKAKFSENPQTNFELLCYQMVCIEFNQPWGIFRYKNQAAIETNPIEDQNDVIGWQAKFYDTSLSKNKNEIIKMLQKAKDYYPKITKLLFYTNKEWGQIKGKKPKPLNDIEKKAKDINIIIEWRTSSFFESYFVTTQNEFISRYFFSYEKSILDLIQTFNDHTENILMAIKTSINFNEISIEIDRKDIFDKIYNQGQQVTIISGCSGVGKTVLVKKLHEKSVGDRPFYVFKATEFEVRNVSEFFNGLDIREFIEVHSSYKDKLVVIDSAEKLVDLQNIDPFNEFLSFLIQNNWKLIFTVRDNYLQDLNYVLCEVLDRNPISLTIQNLKISELSEILEKHSISIPKDEKLIDLIRNPFYLNEYLQSFSEKEIDYIEFKTNLWGKKIKKAKPQREQLFLEIALERAQMGYFFIKKSVDDQGLVKDGILGYESSGYFITHDIYEEWALEKIIEREYSKKTSNRELFTSIGDSLPIRKSFRKWVSEKLYLNNDLIKHFIEKIIDDEEIERIWKDEILVSILLSDYSELFFQNYHRKLFLDDYALLKKLSFFLRIACKEVDYDFVKQQGFHDISDLSLEFVFTKPYGKGWESFIKFIFDNIKNLGLKYVDFVLPIIYDWNSNYNVGETTRLSSLIALQYYEWIIEEDKYYSSNEILENLISTILYGASEIKVELSKIFERINQNKWKNSEDPYYELSKVVLSKFNGIRASEILPEQVLKLADLFWTYSPQENDSFHGTRVDINQDFNIEEDHFDYFPASAYQTPIYWLLSASFKKTLDFIIEFTNKSITEFANSDRGKNEVEEIEIINGDGDIRKQYICNRLWCTYRSTQVSPNVLESMHMALEKFFIEIAKDISDEKLSYWLRYLIKNSCSSSITAVVSSIVSAFPEKTFNVALMLFQTKEFFFYDTNRFYLDQVHKSKLLMLHFGGRTPESRFYNDERLKAWDDPHRKWNLEELFLKYQFSFKGETSEEELKSRQVQLWEILDRYYDKLPPVIEQTHWEKVWNLYLGRMDKRNMEITFENTDNGVAIKFTPDIEPDLKNYSDDLLTKNSEKYKYNSLKMWADYKLSNDENYKQFTKYENTPNNAIKEVKEIVSELQNAQNLNQQNQNFEEKNEFLILNQSIPAYVCAALIRFYFDKLNQKDKKFCKNIILDFSISTLNPNYNYQIGDGSQQAISVLPLLYDYFSTERKNIKIILLLTLFLDFTVNLHGNLRFNIFTITAIHELRKKYPKDADSLLIGYMRLKPIYEEINNRYYKLNADKSIIRFLDENKEEINKILNNKTSQKKIFEYEKVDLLVLGNAFNLIPIGTNNNVHKEIAENIIATFCNKIFSDDRDDKIDYMIKHDFIRTYSYFILDCEKNDILLYLKPLLNNFNISDLIADLLLNLIYAEDSLKKIDNFWLIWNLIKEEVIQVCFHGDYYHVNKMIRSFLFSEVQWNKNKTEWHTLRENDKHFFKEISDKLGHHPSTLYAISKLLNDIGSSFLDDGVLWLSKMIKNNQNYNGTNIEKYTIFYIEKIVRRFIYINREKIKRNVELKESIIVILNFLINKGSVIGYRLREYIV